MPIKFHKMHGLGNDFVLLDLREQDLRIDSDLAARLANRHTGIGCDQVLVLRHPPGNGQLASFEIWNADGSQAEQCGNGVRCMGLYLQMQAGHPLDRFSLAGPAGDVHLECLANSMVQVDMGRPVFTPAQVPIKLEPVDGWYRLEVNGQELTLGAVSMGNPHALMIVDDIERPDIPELGAAISAHAAFPEGCNAGFASLIDRQSIHLRVFERGSGETLACGSGACAAVSILRRAGLVDERVRVTQKGGDLIMAWQEGDKTVTMKGPATHVFEGKIEQYE